jgi:hypothetical protein
MVATLAQPARRVTVDALREWAGAFPGPFPATLAAAMAFLEAFKQSGTCPQLSRATFVKATPMPPNTLATGVQFKAVRAILKTFSPAMFAAWCQGGDTTLVALALQAIQGQLLSGGAGWTPDE